MSRDPNPGVLFPGLGPSPGVRGFWLLWAELEVIWQEEKVEVLYQLSDLADVCLPGIY